MGAKQSSSSGRAYKGALNQTLAGHRDVVLCCAFSADGKFMASCSADRTIVVWDAKTFKFKHQLRGHSADVTAVCFSPESDLLLSCKLTNGFILYDSLNNVVCNSGGKDRRVILWDPKKGKLVQKATKHQGGILHCAYSLDNNSLFATASVDKTIGIWQIKAPKLERKELAGHKGIVHQVCFSSDNVTLASCSEDKSIILWNRRTARRVAKLKDPYSRVLTCQFSPNGILIAAIVEGERVRIWNTVQGEVVNVLEGHHIQEVLCCAFSPDGNTIATGSGDKTYALWNVHENRPPPDFHSKAHEKSLQAITFSPTGKYLVTGSFDRNMKVWIMEP